MMKHAFLIMAHNNLEILQTLVSMLDDERNDIFLHIDLKSNMLANHPMSTSKARLFVLEHRVDVRWGNLSQIRTEYALLEEALKHPKTTKFAEMARSLWASIVVKNLSGIAAAR